MNQEQPTNVRFNRGGNIFNTLNYYAKSGITARDLMFLNGDDVSSNNTTADILMLAEPWWVDEFLGVVNDGTDIRTFLDSKGGVPIVGTTRLSLMNPDFPDLKPGETKLVVAAGQSRDVTYGPISTEESTYSVTLYDNSVSIFDILFAGETPAPSIYGGANDYNIPTGQAVKAMIEQGIANVAGAMEYKGALTYTDAKNGAGASGGSNREKGWVYIASSAIYGYAKSGTGGTITYTYSATTSTTAGALIFSCESGDMVIVNNDFNAGVPFATTTVAAVSVTANCDVFERNLTGAVTASSAFGAANRVILSNSANRDVVSLQNGQDKQVLTLVSGVPTWANPSSAGTVDLSIDESSNVFYSLLFCHEASNESPDRGAGQYRASATVYYSRLAGFNPNTAKFGSADISVHRTGDLSEEAAWVSQSIFWNVLETES